MRGFLRAAENPRGFSQQTLCPGVKQLLRVIQKSLAESAYFGLSEPFELFELSELFELFGLFGLTENLLDQSSVYVREPHVPPVEAIRELLIVESHQMQDGRVQFVD